MKKMKKDAGLYLALGVLLALQLLTALYFCEKKTGFHYDEYYSYYSSNVTYGLVPTDREWKDASEIRSEFMVLPGEGFHFSDVVRMQTYDVHPPFYYLLLHAVCSLTPGVFSKWQGLVLNLLFFAASWCLLALLAWHIGGKKKEAVIGTCLLYGFNPAVLSGVMLVRMYALLALWTLLVTWLHVKALERRWRGWKFYLPLMLTVYLGFLTHYYFAVYLFFLAAAMEFYLLLETAEGKKWGQKWKDCFIYGFAVVGGMILAVVSYPACLGHIFRGYRGTEAMGEFFDAGNTLGRVRFFAGLLNEYVFGSMLPLLALVILLLCLTVWTLGRIQRNETVNAAKKKDETPAAERTKAAVSAGFAERYRCILIPAAATLGYFAVVTKTALLTAEEANRYQIPVYGLILMFSAVGLFGLAQKAGGLFTKIQLFKGNEERVRRAALLFAGAMVILLAVGELFGLTRDKVLFLYEEDAANIAFAQENRDVPTVYFYNGNLLWMIWDDSLELMQYDEIYFVNMADVSPIADDRLAEADRALVYVARGENSDAALEAVQDAMTGTVRAEKLRELLYCDLYELTIAK